MKRLALATLVLLAAGSGCAQHAQLIARSVLPARTFREGSPPSGAFFSAAERAAAAANGIPGPETGSYLSAQPVQGLSSLVPAAGGAWWALADNGYAWRGNSADFQLVFHRVDPRFGERGGTRVLETVVLRDPDRRIPWTIVCDPEVGRRLPDFDFNGLPPPPLACGPDRAARVLTGFDLDPESFVRAPDGTFWIGDEFGPFLIHVAADGRVLEPPVEVPGVRSPQNPFLAIADRARPERPTVAASRGFEGLAISPDGRVVWGLLEGAVVGDDAQDLRIYVYDLTRRAFRPQFLLLRLELPSQGVDLTSLLDAQGARVYPEALPPPRGPVAIGELKAVNERELLVIERDNLGDGAEPPRIKKVFLLETGGAAKRGGHVAKRLLLDLLAIPDPSGVGGDGGFFSLPFYTLESVHVVDERTLLIGSDNNFPFSNGRARSLRPDRGGPLAADDTEIVLVRLGERLAVDRRLLGGRGP